MKIIFLGTASMQPTKERNLSSLLFNHDDENILFDCGEGTQRQMKIVSLKSTKITRVIISHFHADHVLGLSGMIRSLIASDYQKVLHVYGPKGLKKFFDNMLNSAYYSNDLKFELHEFSKGIIFENDKFSIEALPLAHSVPSFGFIVKEKDRRKVDVDYTSKYGLKQHPLLGDLQKGKDIVYEGKKISYKKATYLVEGKKAGFIFDTGVCDNCYIIGKNADLLVSESTFSHEHEDKALEYKHLTSKQAANIAKKSKSKKLVLTHFSQRYKDESKISEEATSVFKNTIIAHDFMEVDI
ncbi:MAG: ribonuclease Z [Nanoarchaeota archaeon]